MPYKKAMKKNYSPFFALCLLALSASAYSAYLLQTEASAQEVQSDFLTYQNSQAGIKMLYPKDWHRIDFGIAPGSNSTIVELIGPNAPAPSVNVFVYRISGGFSLKDLVNNTLSQIEVVHRNATETLHLSDNTTAYQTAYQISTVHNTFQKMQLFTMKNGLIYVITYTSTPDVYSLYLPTVNRMIGSITLSKPISS